MSGRHIRVERSQVVAAPVERVWPLLSGPEASSLRPSSFAFDVPAPPTARYRVVVSIPRVTPVFVAYEVREEVRGRVVSLTLPGRPSDETFRLSVLPERAGSRVTIQIRDEVAHRKGQAVVQEYWQQAVPLWLAGLCDVAEGRAPVPDSRMPAAFQAACAPAPLEGSPASVSASAQIAAPAGQVWDAVRAPESAISMSPGRAVLAGVVPGTPVRQVGEMQYAITRLENGQVHLALTRVMDTSAGSFALTANVGRPPLETLYHVVPDGRETRLDLTFRWTPGLPDGQGVAGSMAESARGRVQALKNLIENQGYGAAGGWLAPPASPGDLPFR